MEPTQEQLDVIQKVVNRISKKYEFSYYDMDDIRQEAFMMGIEALPSYDSSRPLENFIAKHISNRLRTLRRDKYFRQNIEQKKNSRHYELNESKRSLMDLQSISLSDIASYFQDFDNALSTREALNIVMDSLPPSMRNDFLRLANGVNIKFYRKTMLFNKIKEILGEDW